ncbi:MAG: hypothetical protein O3A92_08520 [Verrucomicrobia bacterium]|nr:hypothetical protein [Verrucomicrobiota bacterium]
MKQKFLFLLLGIFPTVLGALLFLSTAFRLTKANASAAKYQKRVDPWIEELLTTTTVAEVRSMSRDERSDLYLDLRYLKSDFDFQSEPTADSFRILGGLILSFFGLWQAHLLREKSSNQHPESITTTP